MSSESPGVRRIHRRIDGVLLLDKPSGISSNRALQAARVLFSARKGGHTGTLDPAATGLLAICFGEATKFSFALLGADKAYDATLRLGYISSTGDAEGEITPAADNMSPEEISLTVQHADAVLKRFIGPILQVPPMFSALKHRGKPMYAYAREGVEVERTPREILIHDLRIEALEGNEMRLHIHCGTGTYIRTLAEDLGRALGFGGAYLTSLRRTALSDFQLAQAFTLEELAAMTPSSRNACLLPVDSLLKNLPPVVLDHAAAALLLQGQAVRSDRRQTAGEELGEDQKIRLYNEENLFLGLGELRGSTIIPKRLVSH